jgi:hypothetical protein
MMPVNPTYDWDLDPGEQLNYVNPVRLNDHVIFLANTAARLGLRINELTKSLAAAKAAEAAAVDELEDFEQDLLVLFPPNTLASKSNKLLDRYVRQLAQSQGKGEVHQEHRSVARSWRNEVMRLGLELDGARSLMASIKLAGEHIQTHLSFVKAEARARL